MACESLGWRLVAGWLGLDGLFLVVSWISLDFDSWALRDCTAGNLPANQKDISPKKYLRVNFCCPFVRPYPDKRSVLDFLWRASPICPRKILLACACHGSLSLNEYQNGHSYLYSVLTEKMSCDDVTFPHRNPTTLARI